MNRLQQLVEQIEQKSQPPVHLWKPDHVGEIDIEIDINGNWFHEGEPILRDKLVMLFASILWFEDGQHYLVTPAEKLAIKVVDSPYIVHQMEQTNDAWVATTNTHEQLIINAEHPVELRQFQEQWVPYINVRYDLWARVNRSIYVQWATDAIELQTLNDQGEEVGQSALALTLTSQGYTFEVAR